ncbi:MAG: YdeI/OmpD-associated family protein [Pseudomonadota bacterium]
MSLFFDHEFEAPICHHDVGSTRYRYTVVFLPDALKTVLPLEEFPRLRISGEVNDHPLEASLTPVRGEWYVLLSKSLLKAIDSTVGDTVAVRFRVADQDAVEVPASLRQALAGDAELEALWAASSAGKQRALAYRVASAKTAPTQEKRIREVFAILRGELDLRGKPVAPKS